MNLTCAEAEASVYAKAENWPLPVLQKETGWTRMSDPVTS